MSESQNWATSPGGDMVRDVIKAIEERHGAIDSNQTATPGEGRSTGLLTRRDSEPHLTLGEERESAGLIAQPGGFRRHHMIARASLADPQQGRNRSHSVPGHYPAFLDVLGDQFWFTRLGLMAESEGDASDEDADDDDSDADLHYGRPSSGGMRPSRRTVSGRSSGDQDELHSLDDGQELTDEQVEEKKKRANVRQTVVTILKSFVCSSVLFLPKQFENGGLLFSLVIMTLSWLFSVYCMMLLVNCAKPGRETYGDIAYAACGRAGQIAVEVSITISQIGFGIVLMILTATTLQDFFEALFNCRPQWCLPIFVFLLLQLPLQAPMAWVRRIKYFSPAMLAADVFLVLGTLIIITYVVRQLAYHGSRNVILFNWEAWPLFLGTSVYMWEGVGLVLPIRASMQDKIKHKFNRILVLTLLGVLITYAIIASLAYAAFGSDIKPVITANLPATPAVFILQIVMCLAVFLSTPLQLFPAIKVMEKWIFGSHGRVTKKRKWLKNAFRAALVSVCLFIGNLGKNELDNFVALIGALCCVPMIFIYPPLFHMRLYPASHTRPGGRVTRGAGSSAGDQRTVPLLEAEAGGPSASDDDRPLLPSGLGDTVDLLISKRAPALISLGAAALLFTTVRAIATWHPLEDVSRCHGTSPQCSRV